MSILSTFYNQKEFFERNQSKLQSPYGDQILNLSLNKLQRGLLTLEGIFNSDDQSRSKVSNLATSKDDYVPMIVVEGKALKLGKVCSKTN